MGLIVGAISFIIIGLLHPVVIKSEYHFGKRCWPVFAIGGILCVAASIVVNDLVISIILAILAFSLFWSILEIFEQEERVEKGWYPRNPKKERKA